MARRKIILSKLFPYHLTNRSNNRESFYVPIDEAWEIFCRILSKAEERYFVHVHAFVLMPNHYHLMVSTPLGNLTAFVRYFQTEVARSIQRRADRINHVFGSRFKWSILYSSAAAAYVYKYVLRNPVRINLCARVEQYDFSSLSTILGRGRSVPICERFDFAWAQIPRATEDRLSWLNYPTPKELEALVGKALRRPEFSFSRGNEVRTALEKLRSYYRIADVPATFSAEK